MRNPKLQALSNIHQKKTKAYEKIAHAARPIVAVLKDHKLDNTALELAAALFELDAIEAEAVELLSSDPAGFFDAMFQDIKQRGDL